MDNVIKAISTAKIETQGCPSWREIIQPQRDVAKGHFNKSEFSADLGQVHRGEASDEYQKPKSFFERTYLTEGLTGLLVAALKRVVRGDGEPVVQLKTSFGGGKTHSLLALYHLLKSGDVKTIPSLEPIFHKAGVPEIPKVHIAVFNGAEGNLTQTVNIGSLSGIRTIWGNIAAQLAISARRPALFEKYFRDADAQSVSPGNQAFKKLFDEIGPCAVLLDEVVMYGSKIYKPTGKLIAGDFGNFRSFIQEISEGAKLSKYGLVVASLPESEREVGNEGGEIVLDAISHTFGRLESIWKPVGANEGFEIVRRRLFGECTNPEARDNVCRRFAEMYQKAPDGTYPRECMIKSDDYYNRMVQCYPIHPEVFDQLYKEWATLPRFQKTRAVLRLMANVIQYLYMAKDASALIMPGSIPLDRSEVRDELTHKYLDSKWDSIVDVDIDGENSTPYRMDALNPRFAKNGAARRVARTIMFGSAPSSVAVRATMTVHERGIDRQHINLGVAQPGESLSDFTDVLDTMKNELQYLHCEGNRYWYDTHPTLNNMASERMNHVSRDECLEVIAIRVSKWQRNQSFASVHPNPAGSAEIRDDQGLHLVILSAKNCYSRKQPDLCSAREFAEDVLNNHGGMLRNNRNMIIFIAPDEEKINRIIPAAKSYCAWQSIDEEKDKLDLNDSQKKEIKKTLENKDEMLKKLISDAWCWLMVPYCEPVPGAQVEWEESPLSGNADDTCVDKARRVLKNEQKVVERWCGELLLDELDNILWKDRDALQIKDLHAYYSQYLYLTRLKGMDVLNAAIQDAVAKGLISFASSYEDKTYKGIKQNSSLLNIEKTNWIVKNQVIEAQLEAERQTREVNRPSSENIPEPSVTTNPGKVNKPKQPTTEAGKSTSSSEPKYRHFDMTVSFHDPSRIIRDVQKWMDEVVGHLSALRGAQTSIELSVTVNTDTPIPYDVVRTVKENCKSLGTDGNFEL